MEGGGGEVSDVTIRSKPLIQSKTPVPTLILKFERHFRVSAGDLYLTFISPRFSGPTPMENFGRTPDI